MPKSPPHRIEDTNGPSEHAAFFRPPSVVGLKMENDGDFEPAHFEKSPEAIAIRNADGLVILWNTGAEAIYGVLASDILGRPLPAGFCLEKEKLNQAEQITLQKGEWAGKLQQSAADGRAIEVQSRWVLLPAQKSEGMTILIINTDTADSKRMEEERLRAQRQECIGELAGGIAHDLNNTLQPTAMAMDLIRGRLLDSDSQELLQVVDANLRRATEFVQQILNFTLGGGGGMTEISLGEIVEDIAGFVQHAFPKSIQIQSDLAGGVNPVQANATQLKQILLNLCVNARDAMPSGGLLALRVGNVDIDQEFVQRNPTAKKGQFVRISVSDTGSGIPQSVRDKIFEPFFTTKGPEKGTGIGLATVLGIVRGHGGFLLLESVEGRGTTFEIYLPAAQASSQASAVPAPVAPFREFAGNGETVLLVDDEPSVLKVMQRSLEKAGYRVLTALDGEKGLDSYIANQEKISVVVTDMSMPGMGGVDMISQLRNISPSAKVILTSGISMASNSGQLESLGADKVLAKPCNSRMMLEAIRDLLTEEPKKCA
jgi:PAS domain S-box-containing protein